MTQPTGAPGMCAGLRVQACAMAQEAGHHVQNLLGISGKSAQLHGLQHDGNQTTSEMGQH